MAKRPAKNGADNRPAERSLATAIVRANQTTSDTPQNSTYDIPPAADRTII